MQPTTRDPDARLEGHRIDGGSVILQTVSASARGPRHWMNPKGATNRGRDAFEANHKEKPSKNCGREDLRKPQRANLCMKKLSTYDTVSTARVLRSKQSRLGSAKRAVRGFRCLRRRMRTPRQSRRQTERLSGGSLPAQRSHSENEVPRASTR